VSVLRSALLCGVAVLACVAGAKGSAAPPAARTVPCRESIDSTRFPYVGGRRPRDRYRDVLGVVSVPPAFLAQVVPTGKTPWAYWRKAGLVVRAGGGPPVSISVAARWRNRAGIAWGYGTGGVFRSLRITRCPGPVARGYAYSGGFYLASPSACVPLVVRVGRRTQTVRFGIGRPCRA
jgi:hypothetical protein